MLLIVTEDGGLLLHHRDDKPEIPNPDCWAGFGGAVEEGETVEDAVLREVREETGLQIANPIFLTEAVDHEGDGRAVSLFYIVGGVRPDDIDLKEGAGVGVHRIEDLAALKITPFVRRAIYSHLLPVIATITELTAFMTEYERAANSHDVGRVLPLIGDDATYWFTDGSYCRQRDRRRACANLRHHPRRGIRDQGARVGHADRRGRCLSLPLPLAGRS